MRKSESTRRVHDMRHFNDQNPNTNPARTRSRAPQLVREGEYTGQVRTIIVRASSLKAAQSSGRTMNGAPMPRVQAVGTAAGKRYE